jgi:hypothetical protein
LEIGSIIDDGLAVDEKLIGAFAAQANAVRWPTAVRPYMSAMALANLV